MRLRELLEFSDLRDKVGQNIRGKFGADLDALAEKGLKNEGADLDMGLNPSQPPFTKREEKGAGEVSDNAQDKIIGVWEDAMNPANRPYQTESGLSAEKEKAPEEPYPFGERTAYVKEEEKEIYDLEKDKQTKSEKAKAEREKVEAALNKAREDYVSAMMTKEKADKGVEKLDSVWAKIKDFAKYHPTGETVSERAQRKGEQTGGVVAEKAQANDNLLAAQKAMKDALKNYRGQAVNEKTSELNASGKLEEEIRKEMEKYGEDVLLATTMREAAKIDSLKSDKQIEQMGAARRLINEKTEEFTDWYRALRPRYKIAVSVGLMGAGAAGGLIGSAAIISAAFAGQTAIRVIGGSMMTAGTEKLIERSQEKSAERKLTKEFSGKFLEALRSQNDELDNKLFERVKVQASEKNHRFIMAGITGALVGTGTLAQAVRNTIDWIRTPSLEGIKTGTPLRPGGVNPEAVVPKTSGLSAVSPEVAPGAGIAKAGSEIMNLKIGSRGPEGAMIDYFKANPEATEKLATKMKINLNDKDGIGRLAHSLWLKSVEGELNNPRIIDEMIEHGYDGDAEGYAKAMRHLGKGFVELDSQGNIRLSDKTSFLDAPTANEALPVGEHGFSIRPGSEEFYNLQQEIESFPLPSEGRIPAINEMLKNTNEQLVAAEQHLNQTDLPPETRDYWQRQKFSWLTEKERLMDGLKITEDKLPQTIKDLLPPEIIDRSNFGKIMDARKFSDLSGTRKELVDKLYIKYIGRSFEELNQLPANVRDEYLDKLNYDIDKIGRSGIMSPANEGNLAHKALMWRNLGEMKHLQEIQEKLAGLPKPVGNASYVVESLGGQSRGGVLNLDVKPGGSSAAIENLHNQPPKGISSVIEQPAAIKTIDLRIDEQPVSRELDGYLKLFEAEQSRKMMEEFAKNNPYGNGQLQSYGFGEELNKAVERELRPFANLLPDKFADLALTDKRFISNLSNRFTGYSFENLNKLTAADKLKVFESKGLGQIYRAMQKGSDTNFFIDRASNLDMDDKIRFKDFLHLFKKYGK